MRLFRGLCLLTALAALSGCKLEYPIDLKYTWDLPRGGMKWAENTGPAKNSKINVKVKASPSGNNVLVAAVLAEDLDATKEQIKKGGEPPKYLGFINGSDKVDFDFVIEAKRNFAVIVFNQAEDATQVDVKIKTK